MPFQVTKNVHVQSDAAGVVRHVRHIQEPYSARAIGLAAPTPRLLSDAYARDISTVFGIGSDLLTTLAEPVSTKILDEGSRLRFSGEKTIIGSTVIEYQQSHWGIPVWQAGFNVTLDHNTLEVTSATSSIHHRIEVDKPDPKAKYAPNQIKAGGFAELIRQKRVVINGTRWLIYQYSSEDRFDPESRQRDRPLQQSPPTIKLPKVPDDIEEGQHYVVTEVLFTLRVKDWGNLNWRALIETESGAVLYLRAFVACAFGNIFAVDPLTSTGDATITPGSAATTLDPLTTVVTLQGLTPPADPADPQSLEGEYVKVVELNPPDIDPPTAPLPTGNFSFSAVTDDFAAVNAYHHCDGFFRMMAGMGFDIATFFGGTTFPVPVDHRGKSSAVNAHCAGDAEGDGVGEFAYGLAQAGKPVGIAGAVRVVLHECGHAILHDHVNGPNFGFAHSAGDSMAAILIDPSSNAGDRFNTFPWVTTSTPTIDRRHDRDVGSGWAWGGSNDVGGYSSEQILSTTHFRAYRSAGGDANSLNTREFAARYLIYLILKATGGLTPTSNPTDPDPWATALMNADRNTVDFEGHPGGAFHKVIRWAFEKQGLYQPAGAPTPVTSEGDPPDVDVYINDGRGGEYGYRRNFWNTSDIWNRLSADGGTTHETPVVGTTNYLYVRIKNRGSQDATNTVVRAFHCIPATGLVWPDDWTPLTTAELSAGTVSSGGETVVGPFEWTPDVIGHECVLAYASADGDLANVDPASALACATGPIPHSRLVPHDNNIGQRNLAPVAGGGGLTGLLASFANRVFRVRNPFNRTVRISIVTRLPDFLAQRRWRLKFDSPGNGNFTLGPRDSRDVRIDLVPGEEFSSSDVREAGQVSEIEIECLADGLPTGGMSYTIDPNLVAPPREIVKPGRKRCRTEAKELLKCLDVPADDVKAVRIKRITVDIDIEDDC